MPSLVEIGSVVLKKKIIKFHWSIFCISLLSPFEHTWISFTYGCFALSLVEIGTVVSDKIFLYFLNAYDQTDDGLQVISKAHLSFRIKWAKTGWGEARKDANIFKRCVQLNSISLSNVHLTLYILVLHLRLHVPMRKKISIFKNMWSFSYFRCMNLYL